MKRVALSDLSDDQLFCMRGASGHNFENISKPHREGSWGFRVHGRCTRCGKERTTIFNIYRIEAAYYYVTPAWHLKVTEPYETADVRLEYLSRLQRPSRSAPRRLRAVS